MRDRMILEVSLTFVITAFFSILIILGIPFHYVLGILMVLGLAFVFIWRPLFFLFGLFLLRPALDRFLVSVRFSVAGIDLGLGGAVSLGLVLGCVVFVMISLNKVVKCAKPAVLLYAFFCLVNTIVFLYSPDKSGAAKVLLKYYSTFSVLILTILCIKNENDGYLLLSASAFSPVIPLIIGGFAVISNGGRFAGTFSHPNILAFYLLVMLGVLFLRLDKAGDFRFLSKSRLLIIGLLLSVLLLTQTRSGWIALLLMGGIYVVFFNRKLLLPSVLLLGLLACTPFVQEKIGNVFSTYGSTVAVNWKSSMGWRLEQWHDLFVVALKKPLIGYGIGADYLLGYDENYAAHNDYVRFFVEAGIVGVLAYFTPYAHIWFKSLTLNRLFLPNELEVKLAYFFVCYIPAFLVMSLTENLASYTVIHWYVWGFVGICVALQDARATRA